MQDELESTEPFTENAISKIVVDCALKVHRALGPGLLESVYENVLAYELRLRGLEVLCQEPIRIVYGPIEFKEGFRADLLVNNLVIVEIKSVTAVLPLHKKILLTYLRLSQIRLGLLINFNCELLKDGISRVANGMTT